MGKYPSEDKKNYYNISIKKYDQKRFKITFCDFSDKNRAFISKYNLDDLNIKFMKIIQFKTIQEFYDILNSNVAKKTLIIKSPYKNSLSTVWKIFPDSIEKKQTFTLVSSLDYNQNISLLFYSDFQNSENVVKEIENSIYAEKLLEDDEISYSKIYYKDHWLIENMFFIK